MTSAKVFSGTQFPERPNDFWKKGENWNALRVAQMLGCRNLRLKESTGDVQPRIQGCAKAIGRNCCQRPPNTTKIFVDDFVKMTTRKPVPREDLGRLFIPRSK